MKIFLSLICVCLWFLTACDGNTEAFLGAEAGPLDVILAVDSNGRVSVTGAVSPKIEVGLGPITLKAGIQETLRLTENRPPTLFILWKDRYGDVQREEYQIGEAFQVSFTQNEIIQEIRGDNNSVIVVIDRGQGQFSPIDSDDIEAAVESRQVEVDQDQSSSGFDILSNASPEQFIQEYFRLIHDRNYKQGWSMLSPSFQANHTFNSYSDFWDTVDEVEIVLIRIESQTNSEAYVYVEADYHYVNGEVTTGHTTYKLIKDGNSWLFDPN